MMKGKQLVAAGLAGLACGKILQVSQDHPSTARTVFTCSAISSVAGATLGVGVAYYRGAPLHVYGVSAGVNFALCSFAFCGVRQVLLQYFQPSPHPPSRPHPSSQEGLTPHPSSEARLSPWQQEYLCSISSGGVAGSLASVLSRHSIGLVVSTGVGGMAVGGLGQLVYFRFHHWRKKRGVLMENPHLGPTRREWTLNSFQDRFLGFWHQRSKLLGVAAEVALLQNDIAKEKEMIASLDQELAALGHKEPEGSNASLDKELGAVSHNEAEGRTARELGALQGCHEEAPNRPQSI